MAERDEAAIRKILPHSEEAEQGVIGSMVMNPKAITIASEMLKKEDFYQQQYGILFETMVEMSEEGKPIDMVLLRNRLLEKKVPPEISDMQYVRDLFDLVPTSANIRNYCQIVRDKAVLRRLIQLTDSIQNDCYTDQGNVDEILERSEKELFQLFQQGASDDFVPIRQVVLDTLRTIEKASKTKGNVTGLATGFTDLDYMTSGFQNSDLILVAARPSMGKTALVLNIAEYMAFRKNKHVAIFSLEMSKNQLMNRLFAMEGHLNSQDLRNGNLKDEEWTRLINTAGEIGNSNLMIDDTPGISVRELRTKCRKYQVEHGLDIVMIDYLQLMSGSGTRNSDSRQQEISEISRSLKSIARELNVPVVALSQLSRAVESRPDKRPILSDLRESGAIEQDADLVAFIYRDDYYHKDSEDKGIAEIIIAKQRNGPIGTVRLAWLPDYTKFVNVTPDRRNPPQQ